MTHEQALQILDNVAANSLMNLKDTQATRQAVEVLRKAITPVEPDKED